MPPPILQWFESSYRTVEERTPDLFVAGYGFVWLPPPYRADQGNFSVGYDVYDRFDLGQPGRPTLYGTEEGLKAVARTLHRANLSLHVDFLLNHSGFSTWARLGLLLPGAIRDSRLRCRMTLTATSTPHSQEAISRKGSPG